MFQLNNNRVCTCSTNGGSDSSDERACARPASCAVESVRLRSAAGDGSGPSAAADRGASAGSRGFVGLKQASSGLARLGFVAVRSAGGDLEALGGCNACGLCTVTTSRDSATTSPGSALDLIAAVTGLADVAGSAAWPAANAAPEAPGRAAMRHRIEHSIGTVRSEQFDRSILRNVPTEPAAPWSNA